MYLDIKFDYISEVSIVLTMLVDVSAKLQVIFLQLSLSHTPIT